MEQGRRFSKTVGNTMYSVKPNVYQDSYYVLAFYCTPNVSGSTPGIAWWTTPSYPTEEEATAVAKEMAENAEKRLEHDS